jgi:hypothetical protein
MPLSKPHTIAQPEWPRQEPGRAVDRAFRQRREKPNVMVSDQPQLRQEPSTCVRFNAGGRATRLRRTLAQGAYHTAILRRCETARETNQSCAVAARNSAQKLFDQAVPEEGGDQSSPRGRKIDIATTPNRVNRRGYRPKSGPCDAAVPLLITDPPVFSEMPRGARIWLASAAGGSRNNSSEALCPSAADAQHFCSPAGNFRRSPG